MAYSDLFGDYVPPTPDEEPMVTPLDDMPQSDPDANSEQGKVISFEGFSSGNPLFLERPTEYVKRIQEANRALLIIPQDDQFGGEAMRELYSPAIALPVPLLYGNEMAVNEGAARYPLIHLPHGHQQPVEGESLDHFILTVIILYYGLEVMRETPDRALITLGIDGEFEIGDEQSWTYATSLADAMIEPLAKINICRLGIFSNNTTDRQQYEKELSTYSKLLALWNITPDFTKIREEALDAAELLSDYYYQVVPDDVPYNPFSELAGENLA